MAGRKHKFRPGDRVVTPTGTHGVVSQLVSHLRYAVRLDASSDRLSLHTFDEADLRPDSGTYRLMPGDPVLTPDGTEASVVDRLPGLRYSVRVTTGRSGPHTLIFAQSDLRPVRQNAAGPVYDRFADIPPFINSGRYAVDVSIDRLPSYLGDLVANEGLDLDPDFQRGHVWTREQQVAYVEFLLRRGVSGRDVYLNCPFWLNGPPTPGAYADFVVVDGLQRITAITRFIGNEIPAFGTLFKDYRDSIRTLTLNTIRVHINDLPSKADVLRWYLQMNGGGTPHSDVELARVRYMLAAQTGDMDGHPGNGHEG